MEFGTKAANKLLLHIYPDGASMQQQFAGYAGGETFDYLRYAYQRD